MGNNSLDENAVSEGGLLNGSGTPTRSINSSSVHGSGSDSLSHEKQALCKGVSAGRLTPQNITIPAPNGRIHHSHNHNNNNRKSMAPKPPCTNNAQLAINHNNQVTCKNSINTVYISSSFPDVSQYHPNAIGNNLSIMNLETTEL